MLYRGGKSARADVNGLGIAYEVDGTGSRAVAITLAAASRRHAGVRELATELASAGMKVLIWAVSMRGVGCSFRSRE